MSGSAVKVGVIGCGGISGIYLKSCQRFKALDAVACADIDMEKARARAAEFGVPRACTNEELLADPEVALVLNLTVPKAHAEVTLAALRAGKSVYSEKPLAVGRDEAREFLEAASERGLRVGCAPDTFLGAGLQTCRDIIDRGTIGEPVAATAFMMCHGHESWHPNPEFFYQPGGGPMFDMGPYYLTAVVNLLGPVRRVTGSARATFPERTITSEPKRGKKIKVEVPTHVAGVVDFVSGAVGTIVTSFDVWGHSHPPIEIYGSEGTLRAPDPNGFGGPVRIRKAGGREWEEIPVGRPYAENSRGIGAADMATAARAGRPHRASGELAYHVLDIMHAFGDASREGRHIELASTCGRPAPLSEKLRDGELDE